jgi:CheY-like chemotaxis protein
MEALGTLAGGIAHDFNNILGAILGNASLAKHDLEPTHPGRTSLAEIEKAGERAKKLVQQILTFSRQQPQERRVISLVPVIDEAIGLLRSTLPAEVELTRSAAKDVPNIRADPVQMHQVLLNLCTNAWHALDGNPGRIEIRLETVSLDCAEAVSLDGVRPGLYACLSVSDTGKGMDAATLSRIFEPFFTTKPAGQGTGLGLASVHGIVHNHDGAIKVVSQPGKGSTFHVYFPRVEESVEAPPESKGPETFQGHGQHILYLDDEEPLVYLASRVLKRFGYRVTAFTRPADCLKAFRDTPKEFDMAIVDFNMPGSSGTKVASALLEARPDIPVVLTSGYITEQLREDARRIGVRQVIYKPNTIVELGEIIDRLIGGNAAGE